MNPSWPSIAIFAAITVAVFAHIARTYRRAYNGEWHVVRTLRRGDFMRRRLDGKWQYRALTDSEQQEIFDRSAW